MGSTRPKQTTVRRLDSRLVALDARTGQPVWTVRIASPEDDYSITGAPRVIRNLVITSPGSDGAQRG